MGEARQQNHLLSHLLSHVSTSMPTLLRVKMLSEMTERETNQKKMSEEMNNKLGETISVMAASEERGESELPMVNEREDTPVSYMGAISVVGGSAHPSL